MSIIEENLKQHSLGKYKHKSKDVNINNTENLEEKVVAINSVMLDFDNRLSALET